MNRNLRYEAAGLQSLPKLKVNQIDQRMTAYRADEKQFGSHPVETLMQMQAGHMTRLDELDSVWQKLQKKKIDLTDIQAKIRAQYA